jgi:hypothetical protein
VKHYVAFDLGISLGEVSKVVFSPVDDPPDDVYTWRVVCAHGVVAITTRENGKVVEVGRAIWSKRQLIERTCKAEGYPNKHQWELVRDALDANDAAGAPRGGKGGPGEAPRGGTPRKRRLNPAWHVVGLSLFIALTFTVYRLVAAREDKPTQPAPQPAATPSPPAPPPPEPVEVRITKAASLDDALALARPAFDTDDNQGAQLLARYAVPKLRWDDVATATTSVGLVLKDAKVERGKRLCASGTIGSIERDDLEGRAVYRGDLRTAEGDEIVFLAVGSTGTLVRRDKGTVCGVVLGRQRDSVRLLGMFDLPENRTPAVEREVP